MTTQNRFIDVDKIKPFKLSDLVGRTLRIDRTVSEGLEVIAAADLETGDVYILALRTINSLEPSLN